MGSPRDAALSVILVLNSIQSVLRWDINVSGFHGTILSLGFFKYFKFSGLRFFDVASIMGALLVSSWSILRWTSVESWMVVVFISYGIVQF